jgi:alkanesulfonate monooxygenase SsuD/methylene tetrahydromethanopterin reductase-like flavin-dependent oxidoreductase (luciferase family)
VSLYNRAQCVFTVWLLWPDLLLQRSDRLCVCIVIDGASPQTVEHNVRWLAHQAEEDIALTIETFLKRKIIVKTPETADKKLQAFQEQLVKDFDVALGAGAGENWFRKHVAPIAQRLRQSAF